MNSSKNIQPTIKLPFIPTELKSAKAIGLIIKKATIVCLYQIGELPRKSFCISLIM
jgi:hypothetical protein